MYSPNVRELVETVTDFHGMKDGIALLLNVNVEFNSLDLKQAIHDICNEKYFCEDCLQFAEPRKEKEGRPYGDTVAYEEIIYMICPECGCEVG